MPPTPTPVSAEPAFRAGTLATPVRIEKFRTLWMDPALTPRQVMHHLNAYPGPIINNPQSLYNWARRLGLPTSRGDLPPLELAKEAAPPTTDSAPLASEVLERPDDAEPGTQVDGQGLEPIQPARAALNARSIWDEAADLLGAGMSVVDVSRDLDLPKGQVSDLHFKLKAERDARRGVG